MDSSAESYRRFRDDGDESGLVEIIRDHKDGLIFYLNSLVGNIHLAEELAEDTFVLIGVKKPKDKGTGSFKTWLYTIGRNLAIDRMRKTKRTVSLDCADELADEMTLEESYLQKQQKIALHRAMSGLKPEYRQILWLAYFEELSLKDCARIMGKTHRAAQTLVYRAREALKTQLETEDKPHEKLYADGK